VTQVGFFAGTGMPDPGWWEALWPEPAKVLAQIGLRQGMDVIDLCSGDGWFTVPIARLANHVIAIDIDAKLLALAKLRAAAAHVANCAFIAANAYDIAAVVTARVDLVFLANAFHGVPDRPRLAKAVAAVLKPGGRFVIVNWHALPREETQILGEPRGPATEQRMTPEQTARGVTPSGLRLREVVELPPYHYGSVFEKATTPD
jgi:ubiquinone/menaquinone biosynthesis C-methylase UbiE